MDTAKKAIVAITFVLALFLSLGIGVYASKGDQPRALKSSKAQLAAIERSAPRAQDSVAEAAQRPETDTSDNYDIVVYGGTPEGVATALSASRHGLKTCLINDTETLGGVWASGELNQMDNTYEMAVSTTDTPQFTLTTQGFNEAFMRLLGIRKMDNGFYDGVFDSYAVSPTFKRLLVENRIDFISFSRLNPIVDARKIVAAELETSIGVRHISAPYFVDASENGDLAAAIGCPYTLGRGIKIYGTVDRPVRFVEGDYGADEKQMSATLMFRLGGVRWNYLSNTEYGGQVDRVASAGDAAWGFNLIAPGFNTFKNAQKGIMLSGLNLGRQSDGSVLVNGLLVFDVDGTLWGSAQDGIKRAKEQLPAIVEYLRDKSPAFHNIKLVDAADTLYVRESRHFIGEYVLTLNDLMRGAQPYDTLVLANHAVDEHPYTVDEAAQNLKTYGSLVDVHLQPKLYGIPLRSLLPMHIDNLALVGRSISCTPKAAASARVISIGISEGQAIGSITRIAKDRNATFKQLALDQNFWTTNVLEQP